MLYRSLGVILHKKIKIEEITDYIGKGNMEKYSYIKGTNLYHVVIEKIYPKVETDCPTLLLLLNTTENFDLLGIVNDSMLVKLLI